MKAAAMNPFVGQTLKAFEAEVNTRALESVRELIESSKLTPVIDRSVAGSIVQVGRSSAAPAKDENTGRESHREVTRLDSKPHVAFRETSWLLTHSPSARITGR